MLCYVIPLSHILRLSKTEVRRLVYIKHFMTWHFLSLSDNFSLRQFFSLHGYFLGNINREKNMLQINRCKIRGIFIGLSKTFDILNPLQLLTKLDADGFSQKSTIYIQSYVNKTIQRVNGNNKFSSSEHTYSVLPQASILAFSPSVFLQ